MIKVTEGDTRKYIINSYKGIVAHHQAQDGSEFPLFQLNFKVQD